MQGTDEDVSSLSKLLIKQNDFANQLGCAKESELQDQTKLDLIYLRFKEDQPSVHELVEALFFQLVNYALPASKRKAIHDPDGDGLDLSKQIKLFAEARRSFIKFKKTNRTPQSDARYGEVGELISFCIASHFLNSPQIAAKMALKTNSEMPVFGLDGIHARFEKDNTLTVFYLESKMTGTAEAGISQYADSASGFETDRKHKLNEYRIATDLSNLDSLEGHEQEIAMEYFDPYSESSHSVRERFVGIIVHSEDLYADKLPISDVAPIDIHEKNFKNKYAAKYDYFITELEKRLKLKGATLGKNRAFMLSVPCVTELKELFAKEMSGEHIR